MIPAPLLMSIVLDNPRIKSRRTRGMIAITIIGVITIGLFGGLLGWVIREGMDRNTASPAVDWSDSAAAAGFIMYILLGVVDSCFQTVVQWILASLTNDPVLCARYSGAFKGTVSLGMCIAFTMDSQDVSYKTQAIVQLVIYVVGVASMSYVTSVYVKDTNYFAEEDVIVPAAVEEKIVLAGAAPQEVIEHEHEKEFEARKGVLGSDFNVTVVQ